MLGVVGRTDGSAFLRPKEFPKEPNDELFLAGVTKGIWRKSESAALLPAFGTSGDKLLMKVILLKEGSRTGIDDVFSPCRSEFS